MFLEFISNNESKNDGQHHSKDAHSDKGEAGNTASGEEEKGKDQKA